jgi:hypothetical protein
MDHFLKRQKEEKAVKLDKDMKELFHMGGTMVIDKGFDVKNYLDLVEEELELKKKQKKYSLLNSTSQFSTFNLKSTPPNLIYNSNITNSFNNTLNANKKLQKTRGSYNSNGTKKKYLHTATTGYLDFNFSDYKNADKTNNSYFHFPTSKSSSKFLNTKNNTKVQPKGNFNLYKAIKDIKMISPKFPKIINNRKQIINNKSILITNINDKANNRAPLAYEREYFDTVFDSRKVINDYNFRKGLILEPTENLVTFNNNKKETSINNVLIDLLNKETNKLSVKEKNIILRNKQNNELINNNIKDFDDFTDKYKQTCKIIENQFERLQSENNHLFNEYIIYKSINKTYIDDLQKILEQIDSCRIYALFIHQTLEKDISRYSQDIFPDYRYEKIGDDYEKKLENVRNFVLDNYIMFYDPRYKDEVKNELKFLNEPQLLVERLEDKEREIMRILNIKNNILKETSNDKKEYKAELDDLKMKRDKEENEYKKFIKEINSQMNDINNLIKKENEYSNDINKLIGSLFLDIVDTFGKNDKNIIRYKSVLNSKIDKDNIKICIREGERLLREQEDLLNNTLHLMATYKEKDPIFFGKIMEEAKKRNKIEKQIQFKKSRLNKQLEVEVKAINNAHKLTFIQRKVVIPYHSPKKKVKKVVNYDLIKKLEDEELLKYK